ncbi:GNAT family N-acetyltransferase [Kitasatospora sp. NPDC002227]|uniref:GNAT family N-acetyltransferase n=1 Tax=Kitasatospora sp. NPDC002227 TaxID=3154773 RepID=UPI00332831F0
MAGRSRSEDHVGMTVIRTASTPEDLAQVARLSLLVHGEHARHRPDLFVTDPGPDSVAAMLAGRLAAPEVSCLLAQAPDGTVVGYALTRVVSGEANTLLRANRTLVLDQIGVDPAAARSGVGSALLDAVRELGRAAGCRRLGTQVWEFNEGAREFYLAAGLRPMTRMLDQEL